MPQYVEIITTGLIPDGSDELGHHAVVATKEARDAIVKAMTDQGLTEVTQKTGIKMKRPRDAAPPVTPAAA
jgi:hypothetical protein